MVPLDPASRRAFFAGLAVGIGFRWFALVALRVVSMGIYGLSLPRWLKGFVDVTEPFVWLCSFFIVPFVAGFLSAFFWRRIHWRFDRKDHTNAVRTGAALSWLPALLLAGCWIIPSLVFDTWCFRRGLQRGETFWNGRLGRQFLGDFSTRDEDD